MRSKYSGINAVIISSVAEVLKSLQLLRNRRKPAIGQRWCNAICATVRVVLCPTSVQILYGLDVFCRKLFVTLSSVNHSFIAFDANAVATTSNVRFDLETSAGSQQKVAG